MPRADNWGASLGGKVYNLGGYDRFDLTYKPLSTVEVLDPATGRWTFVANMIIPRYHAGVIIAIRSCSKISYMLITFYTQIFYTQI